MDLLEDMLRCVYILIIIIFSIDTQYIYKQTKYITVLYQDNHPYAGYVNYLKEFLPIIGGTLVELDALPPGANSIPQQSIQILSDFSSSHRDAVYMVILADPDTTISILEDIDRNNIRDDINFDFGVMESYNYNYYTSDILTLYYAEYMSYYNILYNNSPTDEDLVFYKLYIVLFLITIDMYYLKYF